MDYREWFVYTRPNANLYFAVLTRGAIPTNGTHAFLGQHWPRATDRLQAKRGFHIIRATDSM